MVDLSMKLNQADFGALVGVSQQAISDLIARGVLTEGASADRWLKEYCGHMREVAAGRLADGGLDLAAERARLAKAQADKVEMQNAERRGELAPVAMMELVLANVGVKVGRILDTIPAMVRRRVPAADAKTIDAIESDIAKCRNMAATMTLADLERDEDDDAADDVVEGATG